MSEQTSNLRIPYILPSQAQKHVICNEAFRILDTLIHLSVLDDQKKSPPSTANEGDCYIVPEYASDLWSGHDNQIAAWQDGGWMFHIPKSGWLAWVEKEKKIVIFNGKNWNLLKIEHIEMLGISTVADTKNKLAVRSEASLFDHNGHGHQLKLNKLNQKDTASIIFQTNYVGHAEIGLAGDNCLHIKYSDDGNKWIEGLVLDTRNGAIGIGSRPSSAGLQIQGTTKEKAEIKSQTKTKSPLAGGSIVLQHNNSDHEMPKKNDQLGSIKFGTEKNTGEAFDGVAIRAYAEEHYVLEQSASSRLSFQTTENTPNNLKERLVIKSDGKIGVGTSLPTTLLDVAGVLRIGQFSEKNLPNPAKAGAGALIYIKKGTNPATLAFSDGSIWRSFKNSSPVLKNEK